MSRLRRFGRAALLRSPNIFDYGGAAAPPYQFEIEISYCRCQDSQPPLNKPTLKNGLAEELLCPSHNKQHL
jgi:hypothetical protein